MAGGDRKLLGRWGEVQAAKWLRDHGHRLVQANWRCRFGEIDIISTSGKYICFTEVKLRKNAGFAQAKEFVDRRKQEKLRTTAQLFLAQHPNSLQPRFDVIEVYAPFGTATEHPKIIYLENAF
jgi:putative endonuclease